MTQLNANVRVISSKKSRADTSRQIEYLTDFNLAPGIGDTIIATPYDIRSLSGIREKSNILSQCIEAYVTNIARYGFDVVPIAADVPVNDQEKRELEDFIERVNADESLTSLHAKLIDNFEGFGYGFQEIIRDRKGRVSIMRHARSSAFRLMTLDKDWVPVKYDIARGKRVVNITEMKQFRRFVQIINGQATYYKELGDPRRLNYKTGQFATNDNPVADEDLATEILHFRQWSEDPYGVPRWISQLPSILGSREAEEGNLDYFDRNTVPPMMITVAGGRLTQGSYDELIRVLQKEGIGKDRQHQVMVIEAVPEREAIDEKASTVQLKVEKLTDARQNDSLFAGYDDSNRNKVLSAFRLPSVLVGMSGEHTYANANTSQFIAETQVFSPLRSFFDEIYNKKLVNSPFGLGMKTVKLRSRSPQISNGEAQVKSLTALNVMGAVTPRSAVIAANKIVQVGLPLYPEVGAEGYEEWMDRPMPLSLIKEGANGVDTHIGQNSKSPTEKAVAHPNDGEVGMKQPEHGSE